MRQKKISTTENQKIEKIDYRKSKNQKIHLARGPSPPLAAACIPDRGDAAKPAHVGTVWARRSAARRDSLCHKLKQR